MVYKVQIWTLHNDLFIFTSNNKHNTDRNRFFDPEEPNTTELNRGENEGKERNTENLLLLVVHKPQYPGPPNPEYVSSFLYACIYTNLVSIPFLPCSLEYICKYLYKSIFVQGFPFSQITLQRNSQTVNAFPNSF